MKKILITIFALAMLTCLFAVGVSAAAWDEKRTTIEYTDFDGNTHTVPVVKYEVEPSTVNDVNKTFGKRDYYGDANGLAKMADDSALCILKDSDGNLTAYPSWYIIDAQGTAIYEVSYGYLNSVSEKTYDENAVVYIEFPQGMTYVRNNGVFGLKGSSPQYELSVTEVYIPNTATKIETSALASAPKLKYIYLQDNPQISVIADEACSLSKNLLHFDFDKLTLLTELDGFRECTNLSCDVDLSKCTSLKTIGGTTFYSTDIRAISLPDSVESIGDKAFTSCPNAYLTSSYLPANLKSIGILFFAYNNCLLDTYIFPEGVKGLANEPFQDSKVAGGPAGKELNLVFLGEVTSVVYLNGNGHQKHAEKVTVYFAKNSLSDYNQNGFYVKPSDSSTITVPGAIRAAFCEGTYQNVDGKITGIEYIYITSYDGKSSYTADMVNDADYGYDFANHTHLGSRFIKQALTCGNDGIDTVRCIICDVDQDKVTPATGNHKRANDYNCATDDLCAVCSKVMVEAISHYLTTSLLYENGYTSAGVERSVCSNDGCNHVSNNPIAALFSSRGHSRDTESTAIVLDISVDNKAIDAYSSYLESIGEDPSIVYGMVAAISATDDKPLNDDGTAKANALVVKFDKNEYSNLQIKIIGITVESYDVGVYACGYVYVGGKVTYINGAVSSDVAQKVSYNSLAD